MLAYHRRMLAFDHWANLTSLDAVAPVVDRVPRSLAWLNHIMAAKRIWLSRVALSPWTHGLNPAFSIADLRAEFETAHAGWSAFLATQADADVTRVIEYRNLKGDAFQSPLGDILAHLPVHGQQHRGQVNADLRAAGVTPPSIDYIFAARSGALGS
jgi:uncharacterized damage-inducible protein DinB